MKVTIFLEFLSLRLNRCAVKLLNGLIILYPSLFQRIVNGK